VVRGRSAQRHRVLCRPPCEGAARQDRHPVGRRRARRHPHPHLPRAAPRGLPAANALRELGIKKGERVIIYMGMVPEAAIAMLACARLGAIHSVVFGGFSAEALRDRVRDCGCRDGHHPGRGPARRPPGPAQGPPIEALQGERGVKKVLVYGAPAVSRLDRGPRRVVARSRRAGRRQTARPPNARPRIRCSSSTPPGSTGRPKGLVHTCGGYLAYASYTHETVFDLRDDDVYACVADVGWITGHTYIVYGPLANGATTLMFESTPAYPDPGRYWDMVERHRISIFYTAPTAIRALAAHGSEPVRKLRPLVPAGAWHRRRADQPRRLEVVLRRRRRGPVQHRRHLVADRDRRHLHLPDRPGHPDQAGLGHPADAGHRPGAGRRRVEEDPGPRPGPPVPRDPVARSGAHGLGRPRPLRVHLLLPAPGLLLHR
jgi:hypothetical protein